MADSVVSGPMRYHVAKGTMKRLREQGTHIIFLPPYVNKGAYMHIYHTRITHTHTEVK